MAVTETPNTIKVAMPATLTTFYTATNPCVITNIYIANDDTSTRNVELYIIDSGGSADLASKIIPNTPFLANDAKPIPYGGRLAVGDFIAGLCDVADKVSLHITLVEFISS